MKCMHMTRFVVREMLVMRHYHVDATSQQVVIRELAPTNHVVLWSSIPFTLGHLLSRRAPIIAFADVAVLLHFFVTPPWIQPGFPTKPTGESNSKRGTASTRLLWWTTCTPTKNSHRARRSVYWMHSSVCVSSMVQNYKSNSVAKPLV